MCFFLCFISPLPFSRYLTSTISWVILFCFFSALLFPLPLCRCPQCFPVCLLTFTCSCWSNLLRLPAQQMKPIFSPAPAHFLDLLTDIFSCLLLWIPAFCFDVTFVVHKDVRTQMFPESRRHLQEKQQLFLFSARSQKPQRVAVRQRWVTANLCLSADSLKPCDLIVQHFSPFVDKLRWLQSKTPTCFITCVFVQVTFPFASPPPSFRMTVGVSGTKGEPELHVDHSPMVSVR